MVKKRSIIPVKEMNFTEICVLLYMLLTVISAIVSEFFPETVIGAHRREGALSICIYGLVFIIIKRNTFSGKWVVYLIGIVTALYSAVCILQLLKINVLWLFPEGLNYYDAGVKYSGEFLGTLGNAGLTAGFLSLAVPILLVYVLVGNERERFWLFIPMIMGAAVIYASKIAAGAFGVVVGLFAAVPFVFFKDKTGRRICIAIEVILFVFVLTAIFFMDFELNTLKEFHNVLHGNIDDSYGSKRIFIWRNTLPLIPERPLLGGGPDTLADRIGVIFETVKEDGTVKRASIDAAHNEYLNIAVSQGIPALIVYLAALCCSVLRYIKSRGVDPVATAFAAGVICYSIQAFFGISIFISAPYFWIIWALLEQRLCSLKRENGNCR